MLRMIAISHIIILRLIGSGKDGQLKSKMVYHIDG